VAGGPGIRGIAAVRWAEKKFNLRGYRGIQGYESLSVEKKRRLRDLYRWRFRKAQETNMARFMILSDQDLFDIARTDSASLDGLIRMAASRQKGENLRQ